MTQTNTYKPIRYFLITFAATFALWFCGAYASFHPTFEDYYMILMLAGLLAPFAVSLTMILRSPDRQIRRDFWKRVIDLRLFNVRTIPLFLFLMPAIVVVSALLSLLVGEPVSQFQPTGGFSFSSGFVPVLILLLLTASFEELGWRGYAFDSIQSRYNFLVASVIFGALWSAWHLPLMFVKDSYQYEILQLHPIFALNFFVSIVPLGIVISWVWIKNGKSVIAAVLFHLIINLSQELLAITNVTKVVETVVLFAVAGIIVASDRQLFLSRANWRAATAA